MTCALSPEILTTETPLSPDERLELYRRKRSAMKLQDWWSLTHDGEALIVDDVLLDLRQPPPPCRRQAS
jgi:hypothetical protein